MWQCMHNTLKRESAQRGQLRVDACGVIGIYVGIEEVGVPYEEKIQWQDLLVMKGLGSDAARLDDAFEPYLEPPNSLVEENTPHHTPFLVSWARMRRGKVRGCGDGERGNSEGRRDTAAGH